MRQSTWRLGVRALFLAGLFGSAAGCTGPKGADGSDGADGASVLITTVALPPGATCPGGGTQVQAGADANHDGALDAAEVTATQSICNGRDGAGTLVDSVAIAAGSECPYGGTQLSVGVDADRDGVLQVAERTFFQRSCNPRPAAFFGLAFLATPMLAGTAELYRVNVSGTGLQRIEGPASATGAVGSYAISPDHTRIAYVVSHSSAANMGELHVASLVDDRSPVNVSGLSGLKFNGAFAPLQWSPDSTRIAFVHGDQLYVVLADGSSLLSLSGAASAGGVEPTFSWSPDSQWVAFHGPQVSATLSELLVVKRDGTSRNKVSDAMVSGAAGVSQHAWAAGGAQVAFLADKVTAGVKELFVTGLTPGTAARVNEALSAGQAVRSFAWSPDGNWLGYLAGTTAPAGYRLFAAHPDGTARTNLSGLLLVGTTVASFTWSPDSGRLLYLSDKENKGVRSLYVVAPDGSAAAKPSEPLTAIGGVPKAEWSFDGSWLGFIQLRDNNSASDLYTVRPDGSDLAKVSGPIASGAGGVANVRASPDDGTRFAFIAEKESVDAFDLYVVRAGGGGLTKVSPSPATGAFGVDLDPEGFGWSPDGSALAFTSRVDPAGTFELYTALPDGTGVTRVSPRPLVGTGIYSMRW